MHNVLWLSLDVAVFVLCILAGVTSGHPSIENPWFVASILAVRVIIMELRQLDR